MDEVLTTANRTTQHGDIFCPQRISETFMAKIAEKGVKIEDVLSLEHFRGHCFSKLAMSSGEQLQLSLNRPLTFAKCMHSVASAGRCYGDVSSQAEKCHLEKTVSLLCHVTLQKDFSTTSGSETSSHQMELTITEGRSILLTGLLANVLQVSGCSVNCINYIPMKMAPNEDDPDFHAWHLLLPFVTSGSELPDVTKDCFLESLPLVGDSRGAGGMIVDAKSFLHGNLLIGKQGFDKNLEKIDVTDEKGRLTSAASVGCKIGAICHVTSEANHVMINIAEQRKSYSVQQSMVLGEMFKRSNHNTCQQHLLVTGGVEVYQTGAIVKQCSLKELISIRLQQMTQAYVVKYGDGAEGPQLQTLAMKMAEAVIKFELLSSDSSSVVKLEIPDVDHLHTNCRFAGAFVLYNYARVATLLSTFSKYCDQGVYPQLPAVSSIDFTLLTDEEEWRLLFQFVLQYPMVTKETAHIMSRGVGVHIDICLKKICLFLNELSHLFSSYYSRVKILLPPEPHLLPLVFARLHLMSAVRQVMRNALNLLAIEPPEQL